MSSTIPPLLRLTERGLYCEAGGFHVDPWGPVDLAVVTHAHGDHLAQGCAAYLVAEPGLRLFQTRLGEGARIQTLPYGQPLDIHGVRVSLHPAGHVLGSAQVRIEHAGRVLVFTGDYKLQPDPTCAPFEPLRCDTFITESTFGLPIYRWPDPAAVMDEINAWWRANAAAGRASLVYAYALGKAQRVLAGLDPSIGAILTHGQVENLVRQYRASGVALPPTRLAIEAQRRELSGALVIAPTSARATPWVNRFGAHASAFVSGWMRIRGARRRRAVDRGFVMSDHADWPGLLEAVRATGAGEVWVTHGYVDVLARWLNENGWQARALRTRYQGELDEAQADPAQPADLPEAGGA